MSSAIIVDKNVVMAQRDLILLGSPGAGKGTHAEYLNHQLGYEHISTGDILRVAVAKQTELGRQAQSYMDGGELVPDQLVIEIIRERLGELGTQEYYLLDGFPRTAAQAEALTQMLGELGRPPPLVVNLTISDEEVVRRLGGRRICRQCGAIFNLDRDGLDAGDKCPQCGGELYQRIDDQPAAIRQRLKVYQDQTRPLIQYYEQQGELVAVEAERGQEQVSRELVVLARGGRPDQ